MAVDLAANMGRNLFSALLKQQIVEGVVIVRSRFPKNGFVARIKKNGVKTNRGTNSREAIPTREGTGGFYDVLLGIAIVAPEREEFVQLAGVVFVGGKSVVLYPVEVNQHGWSSPNGFDKGLKIAQAILLQNFVVGV